MSFVVAPLTKYFKRLYSIHFSLTYNNHLSHTSFPFPIHYKTLIYNVMVLLARLILFLLRGCNFTTLFYKKPHFPMYDLTGSLPFICIYTNFTIICCYIIMHAEATETAFQAWVASDSFPVSFISHRTKILSQGFSSCKCLLSF